jgi:ABC-type branched-subunit amino acid transport system ATPase component
MDLLDAFAECCNLDQHYAVQARRVEFLFWPSQGQNEQRRLVLQRAATKNQIICIDEIQSGLNSAVAQSRNHKIGRRMRAFYRNGGTLLEMDQCGRMAFPGPHSS